jgi:hypothetical protein
MQVDSEDERSLRLETEGHSVASRASTGSPHQSVWVRRRKSPKGTPPVLFLLLCKLRVHSCCYDPADPSDREEADKSADPSGRD